MVKKTKTDIDLVSQYLPKTEVPNEVLIQGRINSTLATELRSRLKKNKILIIEWMEASATAYLGHSSLFNLVSRITAMGHNDHSLNLYLAQIENDLTAMGLSDNERFSLLHTEVPELLGFTAFDLLVLGKHEVVNRWFLQLKSNHTNAA